jgi:hypothetical protein
MHRHSTSGRHAARYLTLCSDWSPGQRGHVGKSYILAVLLPAREDSVFLHDPVSPLVTMLALCVRLC